MHQLSTWNRRRWLALCVAVGCSLALTIITVNTPMVAVDWARLDKFGKYIPSVVNYHWPSYALQFSLWLALIVALWWAFRDSKAQYIPNIPNCAGLRYITPVIIITLLGFGLRLYSLDRLPLLVDEIGFAARASDMLHGQHIPIFAPAHNGNPATFSWLLSGTMAIFGQTRFAMRLVTLAFGTLSIAAVYTLGRVWWSRRMGLIAAVFVATYPAHVYFSRLALYNLVDPFFALLALTALGRVVRRMRLSDFAQVGIWAGIAQYFYHGSRLLPVLIIVYMIVHGVSRKGTNNPRASVGGSLAVMAFAFIVVSLPRFAPMLKVGLPVTGNLNTLRLPTDLNANALRAVLAWVGQPDISPFWLSGTPLFPLLALIAGGVGLVICVRRLRDPRYAVLVLMLILTTIFGGVIWIASPLYVRYMTALPAIALMVALPFETAFMKRRRWAWILIAAIVLQGAIVSIQQSAEAYGRVPAGLWEQDSLARGAAQLPAGIVARLKVSADFGQVDRITIADYVAAYGVRRSVTLITK